MTTSAVVLLTELVVLFVGVSFALELAQRRLGPERLRAWMGGPPVVAALKGIAVGFVTPFCTYSAVPLLIGLRRAGVAPAGYVAFIVAAPVLDPVLFGALVLIVGVEIAVLYAAVAFVGAMTLALTAERVGIDRHLKPLPEPFPVEPGGAEPVAGPITSTAASTGPSALAAASCGATVPTAHPVALAADPTAGSCAPTGAHPAWRGLRAESAPAARAAGALLRSFGPLLVAGVAIGLAIERFVSAETAARITGGNAAGAIPVAAALGTPLYFSTELFVPIADSLHAAGVGAGAIVALTIAGAGANVPEFVILSRLARPRLIAVLFGYVFAVATIGGLLAASIAG